MFSIREYRHPDDFSSVLALWERMEKGVEIGRSDTMEEISKKIARDPELFLLAVENDQIIGSVIGGYDGRRGLLYHLAVSMENRNRGVGGKLLDEVEARLRGMGCLKCYLMVVPGNDEVEAFYQKRGWHHMDYVRPFGKVLQ